MSTTTTTTASRPGTLFDGWYLSDTVKGIPRPAPDGLPDSPAQDEQTAGLNPFQRRQAQFVDRVLYFEKVIAWALASKAEVLTEARYYTTNTAETGRPHPPQGTAPPAPPPAGPPPPLNDPWTPDWDTTTPTPTRSEAQDLAGVRGSPARSG